MKSVPPSKLGEESFSPVNIAIAVIAQPFMPNSLVKQTSKTMSVYQLLIYREKSNAVTL